MILFMYNTVLGCSTWDSQQDFELWGYLHGVLEAACAIEADTFVKQPYCALDTTLSDPVFGLV